MTNVNEFHDNIGKIDFKPDFVSFEACWTNTAKVLTITTMLTLMNPIHCPPFSSLMVWCFKHYRKVPYIYQCHPCPPPPSHYKQ